MTAVDTGTATPAEAAELTRGDNLAFTAVTAGSWNNITIEITDSNGVSDAVSANANAILVELDTGIADYVTDDIQTLTNGDVTSCYYRFSGDVNEPATTATPAENLPR